MSTEIIVALISAGVVVAGYHFSRRKARAETEKTYAETIETLRGTVNSLVKSTDDLYSRVFALERERERDRRKINGLRDYISRLFDWLKAQNLSGYPEPDNGLLDTDPNIRSIK